MVRDHSQEARDDRETMDLDLFELRWLPSESGKRRVRWVDIHHDGADKILVPQHIMGPLVVRVPHQVKN
jgi:hypothetical protein